MGQRAGRRRVTRFRGDAVTERPDTLATEEPMEIRVGGRSLAVTMRTPGDDFELAVGFLVSEGFVGEPGDVVGVRYCDEGVPDPERNIVDVTLAGHLATPTPNRNFFTTSSCGLCGKESLDAVRTQARWTLADDRTTIERDALLALPDRLREQQAVFDRTGGLHAAGLFTPEGELLCLREDVGRHNAVDKVVGWGMLAGRLPLRGTILQVSGRTSFELVQKAWMAGVPILSAVSAPSTLAADLAEEAAMTLAGFVRGTSMNLYAGAQRVVVPARLSAARGG